jgi:hypothetical protein
MDKNLLTAIKDLQREQLNFSLVTLQHVEAVTALRATLFFLDSRAQEFFEKHLVAEHSKNQKRREELQMLISSLDGKVSSRLD